MMAPAVTRTELNNADDIIREVGVDRTPHRLNNVGKSGSQAAGCKGKTPFISRPAAEIAAPRGAMTYRCRFCRKWHVGGAGKK